MEQLNFAERTNNRRPWLLCRYYLSCLGQDDVSEISVWARSKHDYDYAELDEATHLIVPSGWC